MRPLGRSSTIASMLIHPDIHREIARQRHQELLANADRQRIANAVRRLSRRRSAGPAHGRQSSLHAVMDSALEVRGSAKGG
jgi:hypothetical protein